MLTPAVVEAAGRGGYNERGILAAVDADQSPDSVTIDIQAGLSGLLLPRP